MLTVRDLLREIERLEALLEIGVDEDVEDVIKEELESLYSALREEVRP
jgi:hypothetical protein